MAPPEPPSSAPDEGHVVLRVDGVAHRVEAGQSVAAVLLAMGPYILRRSPNRGGARSAFCMMGACQECAIVIDGAIRRACQVEVRAGMEISRRGAGLGTGASKQGNAETTPGTAS